MNWAAVFCLFFSSALAAKAGPFQQAYEGALLYDATFHGARAELDSAQQNIPMARALLLPSVSLSISDSKVSGTRSSDDTPGKTIDTPLDYRAPVQSLSFRTPLYNREGSQKLKLAHEQVKYAQSVLAARRFELLERLSAAYLQRLMAEQSLLVARSDLAAAQLQSNLSQRALQMGEGTRPDVVEAAASLEMAKVALLDAQNQLLVDDLSLRQITGPVGQFSGDLSEVFNRQFKPKPIATSNDSLELVTTP